ncbi:hypothetical protein ACSNOK_32580 [Streptomyces sp. URMC 126]|uniref:hypothetical protein n=1 Tax=Streptomyces sp. URMC 126 TaxID=3423401 RepID=UPI003F1ABFB9
MPRFLMTGAAVGVLAIGGLLGGVWLASDGQGCLRAVGGVGEEQVAGEYEGPSGAGDWRLSGFAGEVEKRVSPDFTDMPYALRLQPLRVLAVGRDHDEQVLFRETDPDNCPLVVLRRV